MITVKQILENYDLVTDKASLEEMKLSFLAQAGLFEDEEARKALVRMVRDAREPAARLGGEAGAEPN